MFHTLNVWMTFIANTLNKKYQVDSFNVRSNADKN